MIKHGVPGGLVLLVVGGWWLERASAASVKDRSWEVEVVDCACAHQRQLQAISIATLKIFSTILLKGACVTGDQCWSIYYSMDCV